MITTPDSTTMNIYDKLPKDFTWPDERILQDICMLLTLDTWTDARQLSITVKDGHVNVTGTDKYNFQELQRMQQLICCVFGVKGIHDLTEPVRQEETTEQIEVAELVLENS